MYAKIFESIYDGSLRRDWKALIVFQQLLVLCDEEGFVDKTPDAISSRTTIPLDIIQHGLRILSSPDADSRSLDEDGRRIVLTNPPRTWGWRIVNYREYRDIRNAEDLRLYWRGQKREQRLGFKRPEFSEMELYASKIGLPATEINSFYDYYEANGWKVGRNPMKNWQAAMRNWKKNFESRIYSYGSKTNRGTAPQNPRNIGVARAGPTIEEAAAAKLQRQHVNRPPGV